MVVGAEGAMKTPYAKLPAAMTINNAITNCMILSIG
jgi:hypothetical protein